MQEIYSSEMKKEYIYKYNNNDYKRNRSYITRIAKPKSYNLDKLA